MYKNYNTNLTIDINIKNPAQSGTLTKTLTLNNTDTENVYTTILNLGTNVKGEINLENEANRFIKINIDCTDNLDSYLIVNSLVDKLATLKIVDMNYKGNLYSDVIKKEYAGKFKEDNGKIVIDKLNLNTIYTKEFTEYKTVDSKADSADYLNKLNERTEHLNDVDDPAADDSQEPNPDDKGSAADDKESNSQTPDDKESNDKESTPDDSQEPNPDDKESTPDDKESDDTQEPPSDDKNSTPESQTPDDKSSTPESQTPAPETKEKFEDIDLRIKQEYKDGDFVLRTNQPQMLLHIILLNVAKPELIEKTQKEINYPIFTYSAFKDIKEKIEIILEPYKGLIARKTFTNGMINYELHYHNLKTIDNDYKKILNEVNKSFDTLMLKYHDKLYIYQSSDIIKVGRYIKELKKMNIPIVKDDNNLKMAQINTTPSRLFN
jgi:hypothetical protein